MLPAVAQQTYPALAVVELPDITRWANAFVNAKRAERKAAGTLTFYREKLTVFVDFCEKRNVQTVEAIDANLLREFLLYLEESGHNGGGIHGYYRVVRCFLLWVEAEFDEPTYRNPIRKVKAPKVETPLLPPVPLADVEAMTKVCGEDWRGKRDRAILLLLLDTGLRASELLCLDLADADSPSGELKVRHAKNGEARLAWLGQRARRCLRAWLKERGTQPGALFLSRSRERLHYQGLRKILETRAKEAGLTDLPSPHDFRRGAAICLLRNGVDVVTVSRLLGHKTLTVTQRYLRQTPQDLMAAHAANSPVDRAGL